MVTLTGEAARRENEAQSSGPSTYLRHPLPVITIGGNAIDASRDYRRNYHKWRLLRDCYEGELQIKAQGERYLLRPKNVNPGDYDTYKSRAYFYNATRRTHTGLLGAMTRKDPEITLPAGLRINLDSVTIDGLSFRQFVREILSEQILVSRYGILVDIPKNVPAGTAPQPYFSGYRAENIFFSRPRMHKGLRITDRIVLLETERVESDIGYEEREIYRVLRLDPDPDTPGELYYRQQIVRPARANGATEAIEEVDVLIQGRKIRYIPFVFVNPANLLPASQDPTMLDLALLNLAHYEATALLQHGRFYAGMPTYYVAGDSQSNDPLAEMAEGLGTSEPMNVGPSNLWILGTGEKAGLLEFNGHGLTFLENAVDSLQLQMQSLGGKMIPTQRKAAALSVEAYGLMEAGDEVTLLDIALQTESALTIAFRYASDLQNNSDVTGGLVELNKEFIRSQMTAREISALRALYESRMIPLDVMYYSLRQIGVVPMEYSLEDFKRLLNSPDQLYTDPTIQPDPRGPVLNPADPKNRPPANNGQDE